MLPVASSARNLSFVPGLNFFVKQRSYVSFPMEEFGVWKHVQSLASNLKSCCFHQESVQNWTSDGGFPSLIWKRKWRTSSADFWSKFSSQNINFRAEFSTILISNARHKTFAGFELSFLIKQIIFRLFCASWQSFLTFSQSGAEVDLTRKYCQQKKEQKYGPFN